MRCVRLWVSSVVFFTCLTSCSSTVNNVQLKNESLSESMDRWQEIVRGRVPSRVQNVLDAAQVKAKERIVYFAMGDLRDAVELYALDHGSRFPELIDNNLDMYLLKTMNKNEMLPIEYISGQGIINPFTKKAEWPSIGHIKDVMAVRRAEPPILAPGRLQYNAIDGTSYAIIGGGANGRALPERFLQPQGCKTEVKSDVFTLK